LQTLLISPKSIHLNIMKLKPEKFTGKYLFLFLFSIYPLLLNGQAGDPLERDTNLIRIMNQAYFNCDIQLPDNFNNEKGYTLLIALHGGGGSYESFRNIKKHFSDPHFILATPEAPYKWQLGGELGYDWLAWPSKDTSFMQDAIALTSTYIETILTNLMSRFRIKNIYLMGFSQGSIVAQTAGIYNHALLDGIIILSGPEIYHPGKPEIVWPSLKSIGDANNLRIFIASGKDDTVVNLDLAKKSKDQYTRWGYDVTMFEFEGGHEISGAAMREIQKWIH